MIHFAKPSLGKEEAEAASRVILSNWVTQGPEVKAFEEEFAAMTSAKYACAVSNCTAALHLAIRAIGTKPGDEIITVSHSFIATANSVRYCGGIPVFVDIEPYTYNINPELIEDAITDLTVGILAVHQMGMPCDLKRILEIADRHNLPVVEDAACAIGSEILWDGKWEKIGRPRGVIACFSLHPRKVITTGDGGMITTNNPDYDQKFRLWRQHSMSVPDAVRHQSDSIIFEEYPELGYNYRMTDIQAAVGREQLKRLPELLEYRREIGRNYFKLLEGELLITLPHQPEWARSNWQSFCVGIADGCDQMEVMQYMLDQGIATRRGVMCAHLEKTYSEDSHWKNLILKESEKAFVQSIILPLSYEMTFADQEKVVKALVTACRLQLS
ncbi:DegT/DnrJ/EryC1/StrS family aminotransferase [bacterium]|nr:DegT/DnrJ/EryC1/StrS family aminotransferase [bacterium]